MTRLALVLVVCSPCVGLLADEPKKPSELEGAWQERALPGEDPSLRYRITFAGEVVTIAHREQVLTGTFLVGNESERVVVTMKIADVKGDGEHTKGTYRAFYEVDKTRVSLHFDPKPVAIWQVIPRSEKEPPLEIEVTGPNGKKQRITAPAVSVRSPGMGLAPVTLTLHKVAK